MPYVRKHGNQLAIVHGVRDPETKKVDQRVLFTLYSRPEAEAALRRRETTPPLNFRGMVEAHHDGIRFDWNKIDGRIAALMDTLPESYAYQESGTESALRGGLTTFTRALLTADPQRLTLAARAVRSQRRELEFVRDLIDWRLQLCDDDREHEFNRDNEYGWRSRFLGNGVTVEAMELLDGLQARGDDDGAVTVARLLLEIWPDYADAYNLIGNVALEREAFDEALSAYSEGIRVGRTAFPKRIAKARWWSDRSTRPYMRALRNTALALIRSGRSAEALAWCDRLATETYDQDVADVYRAAAYLNVGRWSDARELASRYVEIWPDQSFLAAFASYELGDRGDAFQRWLRAAIQMPRAAWMLVGGARRTDPEGYEEVSDHNAGVALSRNLDGYLAESEAIGWFARLTTAPEVVTLTEEYAAAVEAWRGRGEDWRAGFTRMNEMRSAAFAKQVTGKLSFVRERLDA